MKKRKVEAKYLTNVLRNSILILLINVTFLSFSLAQSNKPVKEGSKANSSKNSSKNSNSSNSQSSLKAMKKRANKSRSKDNNSSSIFPTFADQMNSKGPSKSFFMKTKTSFSTMMTNYKKNAIFPNANVSQNGKLTFAGLANKSNGLSSSKPENISNSNRNLYKRRTRGPFFQNSSAYAKIKQLSLGKLHNKYNPERKIEQTYNPNLRYYNLPK